MADLLIAGFFLRKILYNSKFPLYLFGCQNAMLLKQKLH